MLLSEVPVDTILTSNQDQLLDLFSDIKVHCNDLTRLNTWWDKVSLIGKINSLNIPQSLLANMLETKAQFGELQEALINNLLNEHLQQHLKDSEAMAQVLVDIPIRNLFERTADVGFLATDDVMRHFLTLSADKAEIQRTTVEERLKEYASKYTVYNDILLINRQGEVLAKLDTVNPVVVSADPAIDEALGLKDDYLEVLRESDLRPLQDKASLFFAPVFADETDASAIGVVCMSFRLNNEMAGVFESLEVQGQGTILALLDSANQVLVSNQPDVLSAGMCLSLQQDTQLFSFNNRLYLATRRSTRGYEGYTGLGWQGCVLMPLSTMNYDAEETQPDALTQVNDIDAWRGFSPALLDIRRNSTIVTDDLDLVVLNGRISAARRDAEEFIPILEEIRQIGRNMQGIFSQSVASLMKTALNTHLHELSFQAALATDIMDRNLYERANDCRWWALTDSFGRIMAKQSIDEHDRTQLSTVLAYINNLYTVYTNIYLYDKQGRVLAVSNPHHTDMIGSVLPDDSGAKAALQLSSTLQYSVSPFKANSRYQNQPTYVYNAAVRYANNMVGGIGLIFDSQPQFQRILEDVIPSSSTDRIGLFVDRFGLVISSSAPELFAVGQHITLPEHIANLGNGKHGATFVTLNNAAYTAGYAVSKGYREYKNSDEYRNDVVALILEPNN